MSREGVLSRQISMEALPMGKREECCAFMGIMGKVQCNKAVEGLVF